MTLNAFGAEVSPPAGSAAAELPGKAGSCLALKSSATPAKPGLEAERATPLPKAQGQLLHWASADGQPLAVRCFEPARPQAQQAIVIASATGVPQGLYRALAAWMAARGVHVYTFDYRGVAASRPHQLRGYQAGFSEWAADIDTVLAQVLQRHSAVSLLGHSIGGFLAPAAPHAAALQSLLLVGAQTAYWRDWPQPKRYPMALLWHGLMPLLTLAVGYFPGRALRLGEDLPRGVAMQWAARPWRDPFDDRLRAADASGAAPLAAGAGARMRQAYARVLPTVHLLAAADDPFATPAAQDRVATQLTGSTVQRHVLVPAQLRLASLGHFDIFKTRASACWPLLLSLALGEAQRSVSDQATAATADFFD